MCHITSWRCTKQTTYALCVRMTVLSESPPFGHVQGVSQWPHDAPEAIDGDSEEAEDGARTQEEQNRIEEQTGVEVAWQADAVRYG